MSKKILGQFMTHPEVAIFMSKLINPQDNEYIIDPACGEGEFFIHLSKLNKNIHLYGCEVDKNMLDMATSNSPNANIFLHNGLYSDIVTNEDTDISDKITENSFDVVIANPPFNGLQNKVNNKEILKRFDLSYKENKIKDNQNIEILFLERFIKLLKPNGRLCTIIPEGILSDERLQYVRNWIYNHLNLDAIISLPKKGVFGDAFVNTVIICGHKKPYDNKNVLYIRDIEITDLEIVYNYMKKQNIFIKNK